MLTKNKLLFYSALCLLILMGSCKKQLDTNLSDPNGTGINNLTGKDIFSQALVSASTNRTGGNISTAVDNYDFAQQWMGFWARNSGWASSGAQQQMETFSLSSSFSDGAWQSLYHNIYDFNFIITHSAKGSVLPGAARAMKTMIYEDLVDQFGDIPYNSAANPAVTLNPSYDKDAAIYKDLNLELDSAITDLSASQATGDDVSDVMFKGDKSLWIKFANTLKLRILLRQVPHGDQTYIGAEIAKILAQGGGFLGAGQDAVLNPGFIDQTNKQNPFWAVYGLQPGGTGAYQNNNYFTAGNVMINFLDSTGDIRKDYFFGKNGVGTYGGNYFGETLSATNQTSPFGPGVLKSFDMPAWLLFSFQSFFMQAEAVKRGLMTGDYTSLFKQGVEESFRYLGVPNGVATADAFMAGSTNGMVNIGMSTNPLQTILYQKWVAECGLDGLEAWSDWRRTGYPNLPNPSFAAPGQAIPQRLLYAESEYTQNSANVNAENQQNSDIYKPIFWAQ